MVADGALAVSPDGQRVAYRCASDLCLADMQGGLLARQKLGFQPPPEPTGATTNAAQPNLAVPWSFSLAWSPDGRMLALATAATDQRGAPTLRLLTPDGQLAAVTGLGPDGPVDPPQWFPDGRRLLLTTYPLHGRRIIVVDAESASVRDLTQPRWDAVGSLRPDGQHVLLWNGRGGLWAAPVETRPE
jgi:dipeptidyl aminopeptidase/acylaminoacyl peptidase